MILRFALPGWHRYERGAEVALLSVAEHLARSGDAVTVMGSGGERAEASYRYKQLPSIRRERFERFPTFPPFRSETAWEDASFSASLICVAVVELLSAPAVVALLDELPEALSPATFEAVSQAVKRKATEQIARIR